MKNKLALILGVLFILSACSIVKSLVNKRSINDYKKFSKRDIHANNKPFKFPKGNPLAVKIPLGLNIDGNEVTFEKYLSDNKTVAFLIIQNDTLAYEKYFGTHDSASIIPSFSISNTFISALIGCAIQDGIIKSVDDSVLTYIPELTKNGFKDVTIKHLLQMTSGLDFKESYKDPMGEAATFYYGRNIYKNEIHLTLEREPGKAFDFTSGSIQLLALVLQRALKNEKVAHYFERRIWFQIEPEFDASWSTDKVDGTEKAFCCMNARALDFAKFGRLFMQKGNWNGKQIIPEKWVNESLNPDLSGGGVKYFKYQWWLYDNSDNAFYAQGDLGQFIYVNPRKNLIIVRLGEDVGNVNWQQFFASYAATIQ